MLPTTLRNYKVLYVEDEPLIAMDGEAMLREIGFDDVVVALTLADAQAAIDTQGFDLALMDINLGSGETSMPIAATLSERGTRVVFASGYNSSAGIATSSYGARVEKPFDKSMLLRAVLAAFAGA